MESVGIPQIAKIAGKVRMSDSAKHSRKNKCTFVSHVSLSAINCQIC